MNRKLRLATCERTLTTRAPSAVDPMPNDDVTWWAWFTNYAARCRTDLASLLACRGNRPHDLDDCYCTSWQYWQLQKYWQRTVAIWDALSALLDAEAVGLGVDEAERQVDAALAMEYGSTDPRTGEVIYRTDPRYDPALDTGWKRR